MRRYLLEIDVVSQAGVAETLRLTEGSSFEVERDGIRYWYRPFAQRIANFETRLSADLAGGRVDSGVAEVMLLNRDGWLDAYDDWSWRAVRILEGPSGRFVGYSSFVHVFVGYIASRDYVGRAAMSVRLSGPMARWDAPFPRLIYKGDNTGPAGVEGGPDLRGREKPCWLGSVRNVEAVRVSALLNIWQCQDERLGALGVVVREGGQQVPSAGYVTFAQITDPGYAVPAGHFIACRETGLVRLGFAAARPVTCDLVAGRPAMVQLWELAGYPLGRLPALRAAAAAAWRAEATVAETADLLLRGMGGWWHIAGDREYLLTDRLQAPETPAAEWGGHVAHFAVGDATTDISFAPLGGVTGWGGTPITRVEVRYGRNWRVLREEEVYGAVPAADKAWLTSEWEGTAIAENPALLLTWPERVLTIDSSVPARNPIAAQEIADRLLAIHGRFRRVRRAQVPARYAPARLRPGMLLPGAGLVLSVQTTDGRSCDVEVLS